MKWVLIYQLYVAAFWKPKWRCSIKAYPLFKQKILILENFFLTFLYHSDILLIEDEGE